MELCKVPSLPLQSCARERDSRLCHRAGNCSISSLARLATRKVSQRSMPLGCSKTCSPPSSTSTTMASSIGQLLDSTLSPHPPSPVPPDRDLKLENFLFEDKGTNSPLKLIDFGLSKHFAPHEQMRQVPLSPPRPSLSPVTCAVSSGRRLSLLHRA
jgi:hypothetical protein